MHKPLKKNFNLRKSHSLYFWSFITSRYEKTVGRTVKEWKNIEIDAFLFALTPMSRTWACVSKWGIHDLAPVQRVNWFFTFEVVVHGSQPNLLNFRAAFYGWKMRNRYGSWKHLYYSEMDIQLTLFFFLFNARHIMKNNGRKSMTLDNLFLYLLLLRV